MKPTDNVGQWRGVRVAVSVGGVYDRINGLWKTVRTCTGIDTVENLKEMRQKWREYSSSYFTHPCSSSPS